MRISSTFSAFVAAMLFSTATLAADWQQVAKAGGERVEIDKARIMRSGEGRTIAWTRLVLGRELADAGGRYTAVQAMNRYDCESGKFATLRRIYMKGDVAVREEGISSPKDVVTVAGSLDGQLLAEACKPRTVGEAQQIAQVASVAVVQTQDGKPGVMYADVRTAGEEPITHTVPVADTETRPRTAAETKIEIRPASERPRFIGLPRVEKAQPTAETEPKPAEVKSAPASQPVPADAISRQERERQMATSGPRRIVKVRPKPVVKKEAPPPVEQHRDIHWSYEGEGAPRYWAKLKPEYSTCATGLRQSPIDIREGIRVDLEPIQFDYRQSYVRIVDNGHSIQVNVGEDSSMTVMGQTYHLLQFHFHRPSEERINGKTFDMVIHLVHEDDEGNLAVIAVLLDKGSENPLIQTIWNNLPLEIDQDVVPSVPIDLNALLPEKRDYYTYMGSLTTPPCTENVLWMVFKQAMPVSAEQINIFSRLYRNNARPIQPSNNRLVKENR